MKQKRKKFTTTDTVFKEGNNDMGTKPNEVKEYITLTIAKNDIDTFNKTEK